MKTKTNYKVINLLVVLLLIAANLGSSINPVSAELSGTVAASAVASNTAPDIGDTITVNIHIDMTNVAAPDDYLGSYTGTLNWDPAVLSYASYIVPPEGGFTGVVNTGSVDSGLITFNGANAAGATGDIIVLAVGFNVIGSGDANLDLQFSAMAAATTFADLLPILDPPTESAVNVPAQPTAGVVEVDGTVSSTTLASGSSISFAHTTGTGENRLMLVGISWNSGSAASTISTVTFTPSGGSAISLNQVISQKHGTASNYRYSAIFSLVNPPNGQSGTILISFSASVSSGIVAGAANFKGVDQTTPLGTAVGASSPSNNTTVTINLTGLTGTELVFDNAFIGGNPPATVTPGSGQTQLGDWNKTVGNARGAASIEQATGSSVTMSWTAASSSLWVTAAVPIKPMAGEPPVCYSLTLTHSGLSGTDPTPSLANSPGCSAGQYIEGQVIGLTAHPDWGYEVGAWSGTDNNSSTELTNVVTMPAEPRTVNVNYQSKTCYDLTLTSGDHGGDPTTDPTFSQACTLGGTYVEGEVITLTAHPDTGYRVASWSGTDDDLSKANTNTLTMPGQSSTVNVTYEETPPEVTLDGNFSSTSADDVTVVTFPHTTGTGDNRLLLVGIAWNCGSTNRTITSITFTPDGGSAVGLSEVITQLGYNTSNPRYSAIYSLLNPPMEQDGTVTITFSGSVSNGIMAGAANFSGVDQTTPFGSAIGANGNSITPSVELTGLSGDELVFDNVFLGASSTSYNLTAGAGQTQLWNPAYIANLRSSASIEQATSSSVTMSWNAGTANYWAIAAVPINPAPASPTTYDLTMAVALSGGGTVTPAAGVHTYDAGTVVPITAVPDTGYAFNYWTPDDTPGPIADPLSASTTVTMDADYTVTAHFVLQTYTLTVNIQGNGSVTRDPDYPAYDYGTLVELTPIPDSGNMFVEWGDGSRQVPRYIEMTENTTLSAIFALEQFDFGDAPDTYKTLLASDGARHLYNASSPLLGDSIDLDSDGQPSELANGDDSTLADDEDGVTFSSTSLVAGAQAQVTIYGDSGKLDAWIDYDRDGVFDHPSELFLGATMPISGVGGHTYSFVVPANAVAGFTYARFRLSSVGGLLPYGVAADGEVEDYRVTIEAAPATGTIIIEKQTEPDGMTDEFTFTGDAAGTIADNGQIVVSGLAPGAYSSTETALSYYKLAGITCDDANSTVDLPTRTAHFNLEAGETVKCTFLNVSSMDYGDAPDSYKTLWSSDGARHMLLDPAIWMGASRDSEVDGKPSDLADGDDLDGGDDEDGVTLPATLVAGDTAASVSVVIFGNAKLDAWIDFDGDGTFEAGEHLWDGTSQTLATGTHPLTFAVPAGATVGVTYARFRLSTAGGLQPFGFAPDGEVEDYRVTIEAAPTTGTIIIEKQTIPDGFVQTFEFTGDASGSIGDGQQIVVSNLTPGPYQAQEVVPVGWALTSIVCDDDNSDPDLPNQLVNIDLEAGETVKCIFTNTANFDFGDAPDTYKTLLASDGARHLINPTMYMGTFIDSELDGKPSTPADRDDIDGVDDEDGVVFSPTTLVPGSQAQVTIHGGPSGGKLDAWIDYDRNGVFDHPTERFLGATMTLSSGSGNVYSFTVPANAGLGLTYARFRLSTAGGLQPYGFAADGEVEDYRVEILAPQSHTVVFQAMGGTGTMEPQISNVSTALTLNTFTRTGYSFSNWNTAPDYSGTTYADGAIYDFSADITLYAQWTANSYTVTFDANGGSPPIPASTKVVTYGVAYGTLATTSRTGYTFAGWFTAASGGTQVIATDIVNTASDHTLYAQWTANSYTVTFDANGGGTPVPATMSVTFGSAYGTLATTSRTGYTFAGWFTAASGGTQVIATDIVNTASDHTLYGQWTANTYTVTFDANGGSTPDPTTKPVTYGSAYGTLATTSRTGYTFVGWFTAASGGTQITSATLVATASDHTLYAQWTDLPTFTVTFDANGGTGTMAPQTASLPTALTLNSFERLGFSFIGWNTVAGGGGTAFANGATYDFDADITLFAQWQIENHTITFNSNGGTGSMTTQISNIPTAITLNTFTRTGFNFTGWNTAANGAGTPYANGAVYSFSADITLYAQWSSMPTHAINLNAGWNLVSFNLIPADPDIEVVLADVLDDVILVYAWNGQTSSWLHFDPDVTYGNNLTELDEGMGFWINMAEDATLPISGTEPTTTAIPLYTGWNLIGYPSEAIGVLPDALDGITGKYNLVMAYHAADTADPWKLYEPGVPAWVTDLDQLDPGWGYWIDMTQAATLSVDFE